MSDFEDLLKDSLGKAASSHRNAGLHRARETFVARRRRRSAFVVVGSLGTAALLITGVVAAPWGESRKTEVVSPQPLPRAVGGEMVVTQEFEVGAQPSSLDIDGSELYVGHAQDSLVETISVDGKVSTQMEFTNAAEVGTLESAHIAVEKGDIWTAADGHVTKIGAGPQVFLDDEVPHVDPPTPGPTLYLDPKENKKVDVPGAASGHGGYTWNGAVYDLTIGGGSAWVAGSGPDGTDRYSLGRFDLEDYSPAKLVLKEDALRSPARLDFGYGYVWAAQSSSEGGLVRFDPDTVEGTSVQPASDVPPDGSIVVEASDVSAGAGKVWAFGSPGASLGHMLVRVDPSTAHSEKFIQLPGAETSPDGVVEADDELGVFVMAKTGGDSHRLFRVDPASGEVVGDPLDFGRGPFALESGFRSLWVADRSKDTVYRIEVGHSVKPKPRVDGGTVDSETVTSGGEKSEEDTDRSDNQKLKTELRIEKLTEKIQRLEDDYEALSEGINFEESTGGLTKEERRAWQRELDELMEAILEAQIKLEDLEES